MLIGDKTGPAIIAQTYGDVRPEHLLKQAQRIRLTVQEIHGASDESSAGGSSIKSSNTSPDVSQNVTVTPDAAKSAEVTTGVEDERNLAQPSDTIRNTLAATLNQLVHGSSPCRGTTPLKTSENKKPPQKAIGRRTWLPALWSSSGQTVRRHLKKRGALRVCGPRRRVVGAWSFSTWLRP